MVGGNSTTDLGLPVELVEEAEGCSGGGFVYSDNQTIVDIYSDMLTQWRTNATGVVGLDYNVLPFIFKTRQLQKCNWSDTFDGIKIMERAAIGVINARK